jgi:hypothetical protein
MWKATSAQIDEAGAVFRYNVDDGVPHNYHLDAFYGTDPSSCMTDEESAAHRQEGPTADEYYDHSNSDMIDADFSYERTYRLQ